MKGFAGDEREFFEKGIRKDRKPVPIHPQGWIDVNFLYVQIFSEHNKTWYLGTGFSISIGL